LLAEAADTAFEKTFTRFLEGSDAHRNERFKIIPNVVEGNWLVRRAVGNTPAILGKKLELTFYDRSKTAANYFEIDVNVGSSSIAGGILKVVKGYSTTLVIELSFLIEVLLFSCIPIFVLSALLIKYVRTLS
jgi:hypothetical protein